MIEIIFVRHGETESNIGGILQGHLDIPLNEKGLYEAKEIAENVKKIKFDELYSSDLKRALGCAEEINKFFPNLDVKQDKLLRERDFGDHQGKIVDKDLGYPDITYPSMVRHLYECDCPNGETNLQFVDRIQIFLEKIKKSENKKLLVVSHGGTLMLLINLLLKEEMKFENSRKHKNGHVSYFSLDENLNVLDSLINVPSSEVADYLDSS